MRWPKRDIRIRSKPQERLSHHRRGARTFQRRRPRDSAVEGQSDVQRGIAMLMWPKRRDGGLAPPERLEPEEVKRRLREWLKSESEKDK